MASSQLFPVITDTTVDEIVSIFESPTLPMTKDTPSYVHTIDGCDTMFRNLVFIKSSFSGGNNGRLSILMANVPYQTHSGEEWHVRDHDPNLNPTFPQDATNKAKRKTTHNYYRREHDIKTATLVTILTHKILPKAFPEEYYMKLTNPIWGYNRISPKKLIALSLKHYAKIDYDYLVTNCCTFDDPPPFLCALGCLPLQEGGM